MLLGPAVVLLSATLAHANLTVLSLAELAGPKAGASPPITPGSGIVGSSRKIGP
jgi:hypothetical protein